MKENMSGFFYEHSVYFYLVSFSRRFRDTATYWSKIAEFSVYDVLVIGDPSEFRNTD